MNGPEEAFQAGKQLTPIQAKVFSNNFFYRGKLEKRSGRGAFRQIVKMWNGKKIMTRKNGSECINKIK